MNILPPRGLNHPVLPYVSRGKLKFPLCRTCAYGESKNGCRCPDANRAITGTWCTLKIAKTIEKGYIILKIYEVNHWPTTTKYAEYHINTFLKLKQEALGWPGWHQGSEALQADYVDDYHRREGISLDPDQIEKNHGLRSLAKLVLNSFWGKWAQQENFRQTDYIYDPAKYFQQVLTRGETYKLSTSSTRTRFNWNGNTERIRIMENILKPVIIEKLEITEHPSVGFLRPNEQHECLSCLRDCSKKTSMIDWSTRMMKTIHCPRISF